MVTANARPQAASAGAAVSISHLHHAFSLGKQMVPVLENISLQLRPGESAVSYTHLTLPTTPYV